MTEQVVVCKECGEENTVSARFCCLCRANIFAWCRPETVREHRPTPLPGPAGF